MVDIEQTKQKLHELQVEQAKLDHQLVMFDELSDQHEAKKQRNLRSIRRLKAQISKFEGNHAG